MKFIPQSRSSDSRARTGTISTEHSDIPTPVFMPVGTAGAVKAILQRDLQSLSARIILANTYHLLLRPGMEVIKSSGGLHRFIGWDQSILTDSGGFQIYSLQENSRVSERGVTFRSHIDGREFSISPEEVVDIQNILGSDIQMVLDYFRGPPASKKEDHQALKLTETWARRSRERFIQTRRNNAQFAIIQGGLHEDLREESLEGLKRIGFEGYAVGGLSVGESGADFSRILRFILPLMEGDKPRYLMGCGSPEEILTAVEMGVDMFDCVLPTRVARNGALFTGGGRISIKNSQYRLDPRPPDETCQCYTCRNFSRAYLRHLYLSGEINAAVLNTLHNLHFYLDFMEKIRYSITTDKFAEFKNSFLNNYHKKE